MTSEAPQDVAALLRETAERVKALAPLDLESPEEQWRETTLVINRFSAAASPDVVLGLLDQNDRLREAFQERHDRVCSCPFDGTDEGCNLVMTGAQIGAVLRGSGAEEAARNG